MKANCILTGVVVAVLALSSVGQQSQPPLKQLVETEQAFSRTSEERGTRDAFLAFIADDGILFRPHAVTGKQWLTEHPVPAAKDRPLLVWQPVFGEVSEAGDLGYTTGPWEFKSDIHNEAPNGYGDFVTVWKKQSDGSWKFAVDLGISHPQSSGPLKLWQVQADDTKRSSRVVDVAAATTMLLVEDRKFAAASMKDASHKAFAKFADERVRLYREGSLPLIGNESATKALADKANVVTWEPAAGQVSRSGDLGYTYGTYQATDPATSQVREKGNYLRIWKRQNGRWRVVIDVANPVAE